MSFLNSNNAEYLSARITNRGRKAIANGNFNIQYFQIGDSEYDYNLSSLTGSTNHQKVFAPFDYDGGVKYPFGLDTTVSTTYGSPISNNLTITLRNEMGAAGFVSKFSTTPTVKTTTQPVAFSKISGTTSLVVPTGTTFNECEYITLSFESLSGTTITGKTNSLIYKVLSISGNTLTLDRNIPNLSQISGLTGNAQVVCNNFSNETSSGNLIYPIDYTQQLNSWKLNTVWTDKPIGADNNGIDENLNGYTGNRYASVKNLLGYTKTGQTFTNLTGGTITGTTFKNSFDELIEVSPSEQRCVAILHYSELGDISVDPERFFKYDDYISHKTGTTGLDISIVEDYDRENVLRDLSDSEYFEVYIPFIYYHRNPITGGTLGARFFMDITDYYVKSSINSRHQIKFRYLVDEQNNKVGKVFVNNKIIVFDDQELVAMLDYRSNRRYTLPSPKLGLSSHDGLASQSMISTTGQTVWVTYMFGNTSGETLNSLPCNYFNKISTVVGADSCGPIVTPSQITMKFSGNSFSNMVTSLTGVTDGFVANKFYALVQTGATPSPSTWKKIDLTSQITGYTSGYINPTGLTGVSFTINYTSFNSAPTFDLEDHMSGVTTNYLGTSGATDFNVTLPQFGDEQPFPGSVRLVRATDIEEMNMMINLPSTQFTKTQNPTYISGDKYITEVALLDSNKEPLVVAKTPTPVKRAGTQVFAIKLDF
jgi:hypothetical protein